MQQYLVHYMKIAFTTSLPAEGFARLEQHTLYAPLEEAEVLVSTFDKPVTREMIMSAPHLKLVTNFGVGFNNIDLETCRERGIRVTNSRTGFRAHARCSTTHSRVRS